MDHRWMETERPSCTVGVKTSNQIYKYRSGYYWAEERKKVALLQNMHSNQREQWWERVIVSDSGTVPGTQAEVPDGTFFSRRWERKKKKVRQTLYILSLRAAEPVGSQRNFYFSQRRCQWNTERSKVNSQNQRPTEHRAVFDLCYIQTLTGVCVCGGCEQNI